MIHTEKYVTIKKNWEATSLIAISCSAAQECCHGKIAFTYLCSSAYTYITFNLITIPFVKIRHFFQSCFVKLYHEKPAHVVIQIIFKELLVILSTKLFTVTVFLLSKRKNIGPKCFITLK